MSTAHAFSLRRTLPSAVFDQLGSVMRQTVKAIAEESFVLTEEVLPVGQISLGPIERFVVIISKQFSGLLLAEAPLDRSLSVADSEQLPGLCPVELTFEPRAIAQFLTQLSDGLQRDAAVTQTLYQAKSLIQPNDPTVQSEFTLQLAELLTMTLAVTPPNADNLCELEVAAALQQQVEQERLLNQVVTQIRRSMNLPDILQIAVQQIRHLLQADRVVVYEFNPTAIAAISNPSQLTEQADHSKPTHSKPTHPKTTYGRITYEACATVALPSVLGMEEGMYCYPDTNNYQEKYSKGFIQAIEDVEASFALSPCLLKLLAKVKARAKLVVPIVVQEKPWGLLIAHQTTRRRWQDAEKMFLLRIADQLAIAIYQARLYAQLQQQKQMLEQRVVERTQELGDALVVAQAANRAKSEFLAAMSHELRTPLTCVIGMAETLLRAMTQKQGTYSLQPQKQQEYLKIIKKSGEHLLELINDILDVSQVEAGKTVLNISQFSLSHLATQCLQMFREKAASNEIQLEMDLHLPPTSGQEPSKAEDFVADRRRVSQILLNLLSNAVKFTPNGGRVTLRLWMEGNTATFQVEDTGIGIPTSQTSLLFQKFQQLDSAYHRKYEGTGLGLALTKQLVELHGGKIEVDSKEGTGSTFTVRIPKQTLETATQTEGKQVQSPTPELLQVTADDLPSTPYTINFGGRIVLVEDHEETAMLICDLLTAAGCQVVWMVDGSTAMKQIEVLRPPLVITDIQLPGMDGFEVMQYLRSHPTLKATKILALTARALPEDRERCLAEGADAYLAKPVQPYQLLDKVAFLVGNQG